MTVWYLAAAAVLLAANAFFVAAEFALVASRVPRLESTGGGDRRNRMALDAVRDLQRQLAGCQLGITVASLGLGYTAEPALAKLLEPLIGRVVDLSPGALHAVAFAVALSVVVILHMVLGEMVPKNIAIAGPERSARTLAPLLRVYVAATRPVIWALNAASVGIVRLFGVKPVDEIDTVLNVNELHSMLAGARDEGVIEPAEMGMLSGSLRFRERPVVSFMVPLAETVSLPRSAPIAEIAAVVASSGRTRVPVWETDPGDITGFVHAKDLLRLPAGGQNQPAPPETVRRMLVTGPGRSGRELMTWMRRTRIHIALVKDDDGAALGIVALEDLLESLVGDIYDETDPGPRTTETSPGADKTAVAGEPQGRPSETISH